MNISRTDIDDLNALVTVAIEKKDYADKVETILNNYRKNANIPGFRKGHVPMGMVKRQYGKAVLVDEVNKLLQDALHNYLTEEKLEVLGNPLPKNETEVNWDGDDFNFEFELGLAPKFEVNMAPKKAVTQFKIVADDQMIDNQVASIRKQYGKLISQAEVIEGSEITGTFKNEEAGIDNKTTLALDRVDGKRQQKALLGAKVAETVKLKTKSMFKDDQQNQSVFGLPQDEAKGLDVEVEFTVEEINTRELAAMDQELFDKLFGKDIVKSEDELRAKIKEDAERQFAQQADQKLLNDVVDSLIANTAFDLPEGFLKRWLRVAGEQELSQEEANAEYERTEKGLRYQLIEGKLRAEHNLQVTFDELKDYAQNMIKAQMAQFGQTDPSQEELDGIAARIMSNQEEVQRLQEQLNGQKMLDFFKQNAKLKTKEVTYDAFVKEAYS